MIPFATCLRLNKKKHRGSDDEDPTDSLSCDTALRPPRNTGVPTATCHPSTSGQSTSISIPATSSSSSSIPCPHRPLPTSSTPLLPHREPADCPSCQSPSTPVKSTLTGGLTWRLMHKSRSRTKKKLEKEAKKLHKEHQQHLLSCSLPPSVSPSPIPPSVMGPTGHGFISTSSLLIHASDPYTKGSNPSTSTITAPLTSPVSESSDRTLGPVSSSLPQSHMVSPLMRKATIMSTEEGGTPSPDAGSKRRTRMLWDASKDEEDQVPVPRPGLFEQGYHDTNPYHNSVHAADVTQAMHCFIQEDKIGPHLTKMETMCAILAAVAHDLDHPGVNQHFLIATNSHLASLYNNLSVLESHHWRFAVSCIKESHLFDHFVPTQWDEVRFLLKSLILATDITQQASYLKTFRRCLDNQPIGSEEKPMAPSCLPIRPSTRSRCYPMLCMTNPENRHFILKIALKCADLGNPCRTWELSRKWSAQICSEFYRQGDFERQLSLSITPICNRYEASMAQIQTDFFKNVVTPLFDLWDQFLSSDLSRQLITNLNFNHNQWLSFLNKKVIDRRHSMLGADGVTPVPPAVRDDDERVSHSSTTSTATLVKVKVRRSKSLSDLNLVLEPVSWETMREELSKRPTSLILPVIMREEPDLPAMCDGIHGCGTPSSLGSPASEFSEPSDRTGSDESDEMPSLHPLTSHLEGEGFSSPDDEALDHLDARVGMPSHPLSPLSAQVFLDKAQYLGGRRGSAPGCIGVYTSAELAAAALVFIQGALNPRRSSAPVEHGNNRKNSNNSNRSHHSDQTHNSVNRQKTMGWHLQQGHLHYGIPHPNKRGKSMELLINSLGKKSSTFYPASGGHPHHCLYPLRKGTCSIDPSNQDPSSGVPVIPPVLPHAAHMTIYSTASMAPATNIKPVRRGSVPQEILIESLAKYPRKASGGFCDD